MSKYIRTPFLERFWNNIDIREPDDCWEWQAGKMGIGYGQFYSRDSVAPAHRVAWELANAQEIPSGMVIMHVCDNPSCCNPTHLILGTQAENAADCVAKGRANRSRGEEHHKARLTEDEVREIRRRHAGGMGYRTIAAMFGVSHHTVQSIVKGDIWKHVE